ncbi:MAG: alkylation response protein AidB-like acyl-CoA dehydrogenase [Gammaproteobacteria bacterium]|jgi:alkylation response protein AidB-like acyl-CoA dehydrogenase
MPSYKAPVEDFKFILTDFLKVLDHSDLPGFDVLDNELIDQILEGGAKFFEEVWAPLNLPGDEQGCTLDNGIVRTPDGFKEAFHQAAEGGWNALSVPEAFGGAGLPGILSSCIGEMGNSANQSLAMYGGLTGAALMSLMYLGTDFQKKVIVPKLVSGEWTGTMNLTEPHCGTDLKLMNTKAVPQDDGTYRISGTKIFISGGDHDMTDNIIHMVIAKIPNAEGKLENNLGTVNFFMVPKFLINEDGTPGARNGVTVGSIEKKMGIKGNATCVLNYDNAVAFKVPEDKPQAATDQASEKKSSASGMAGMFLMMNGARMGVGMQGYALAEVACQNAAIYANDRLQGRSLSGIKNPDGPADPIIVYPDVRRMLMMARSFAEGARALHMWLSFLGTTAVKLETQEEKTAVAEITNLLTPVIKGYLTDMGFISTNAAMQCFGGHGFIREHGMEQFVRDSRINQIYEGANGVQALDLVGRKLFANGMVGTNAYYTLIDNEIAAAKEQVALQGISNSLARGLSHLREATSWIAENALQDREQAGAASYDFMTMFGTVSLGFMWLKMMNVAQSHLDAGTGNTEFLKRKVAHGNFWAQKMLPDTASLLDKIKTGGDVLMELEASSF